ncbi:MAG: CoA pyrophosphatase [Pseudomonadota bacterium]
MIDNPPTALKPDDIRRSLRAASHDIGVGRGALRVRGDHDFNPDLKPKRKLIRAAVLVPLIERSEGMTVLLTRRTDHLAVHAGQISFPGGRVEADDPDEATAALREAEEEIGLSRARVEIAGRLDTYQTRTGYEVTPLVGLIRPPFAPVLDRFEVAEIFEVPLAFVLDPANHRRHAHSERGVERRFWVLPYGHYYIWGATAGMLVNLYEVLRH